MIWATSRENLFLPYANNIISEKYTNVKKKHLSHI